MQDKTEIYCNLRDFGFVHSMETRFFLIQFGGVSGNNLMTHIWLFSQILDRNHRGQLSAKQFQDLFDSVSRQRRAQVSEIF